MQFLKKHYEKLILAVLLVLFIFSMIYLIEIIASAAELKSEALKIQPRHADWQSTDFAQEDFKIEKIFLKNTQWNSSKSRNGNALFSDLLLMFPCVRCPHCEKYIPLSFCNDGKKCELCQNELKPVREVAIIIKDRNDLDNDGIPNDVEVKLGMNQNDPEDAHNDMDGDGFSNLFEYKEETQINNPKSFPPMYKRLYMSSLKVIELDAMLMKVLAVGDKKENWDIQVNIGERTRFVILGDTIPLEKNRSYKIVDVIYDVKKVMDGNVEVMRDESKIICQSIDGKYTVTMEMGRNAKSPLPKAFLTDIADGKEYSVDIGDRIKIGDPQTTGVFEYTISEIDTTKWEVKVIDRRNRKAAPGIIGKEPLFKLNETSKLYNRNRAAFGDPTGIPGL